MSNLLQQNVSSHPKFNKRSAEKSNSPGAEYESEGHHMMMRATTAGTRSNMSRVGSVKGPRNLQPIMSRGSKPSFVQPATQMMTGVG